MNPAAPSRLSRLTLHLWLTAAVSVLLAGSFALYVRAEKEIDHANNLRQRSFMLSDELRQSSDDLTRMVRTYVATGDPAYKRHFEEIVAIRDGKAARPANYPGVYWDLVLPGGDRPSRPGEAVALRELISRAGFTEQEMAILALSKQRSDELTGIEHAAMRLVESAHPATPAIRDDAIAMLYGPAYHRAKAGIMGPIHQFADMTGQRTLAAVRGAEYYAYQLRLVFLCLVGLLLAMIWSARGAVLAVLGGPVQELYRRISRLGGGDFSPLPPVAPAQRDSVLGWIGETHARLAHAEADRALAEQELAAYRSGLERTVEERTRALATALNRAEDANRAKSVFLSNMSHELRTPLNAVIGFSRMMEGSPTMSVDEQENMRLINHSANHLLALINEVLELSRVEAGRMQPLQERCDVAALLREVLDLAAPAAARAGLALSMSVPTGEGELPAVRTDAGMLRHVLASLLDNAIKFTRRGSVVLAARSVELPQAASVRQVRLSFEVRDTGIGIAPEDLQRIFNPFVQMHGSATSAGTGLGLSISRRYVQLFGGQLEVESVPDQGSVFRFELTLEREPVPALEKPAVRTELPQAAGGSAAEADPGLGIDTAIEADKDAAEPQELLRLDDATYTALCEAVIHLDRRRLGGLLAEIERGQPQLARVISGMAERLEYKELWDLLQRRAA